MKQLMSIKEVLDYLEKAPTKFYVSSFSGGAVHVKFLIPEVFNNPQEKETDNDITKKKAILGKKKALFAPQSGSILHMLLYARYDIKKKMITLCAMPNMT